MALVYAQNNLLATTGAPSTVTILLSNLGSCAIQLAGTFVGTVLFEATVDNSTWVALSLTPSAGGAAVTSATAPGIWQGACGGYGQVRARCSAFTSGVIIASVGAAIAPTHAVVSITAAGALDGDGSEALPLSVLVDGVTIEINGSDEIALKDLGDATGTSVTLSGDAKAATFHVGAAAGIDASITTATLVAKTITVTKGLITGFA